MCIGSNSVNQAQDLMIETKIEDLPNSLLPNGRDIFILWRRQLMEIRHAIWDPGMIGQVQISNCFEFPSQDAIWHERYYLTVLHINFFPINYKYQNMKLRFEMTFRGSWYQVQKLLQNPSNIRKFWVGIYRMTPEFSCECNHLRAPARFVL